MTTGDMEDPVMDTLPPRRCGCVPHLSILYEDKIQGTEARAEAGRGLDDSGVVEDMAPEPRDRGGWTKRIPLLGPFWCVRNTHSTTVRRRSVSRGASREK